MKPFQFSLVAFLSITLFACDHVPDSMMFNLTGEKIDFYVASDSLQETSKPVIKTEGNHYYYSLESNEGVVMFSSINMPSVIDVPFDTLVIISMSDTIHFNSKEEILMNFVRESNSLYRFEIL